MMNVERGGIYNWEQHEGPDKPVRVPRNRVEIDDETWRDGMQGTQVAHHPSTEQRLLLITKAIELGFVDHFDIGFPASGPSHRDQIVSLVANSNNERVSFSAAGRGAAVDDVRAIMEVSQRAGVKIEADLFLDPTTLRADVEGWDRDEKLKQLIRNIERAKREGLPVMFVAERASVTSPSELFEACRMAADAGADRIAIADTTGVLTPGGTSNILRELFDKIGKKYPEIKFDFHQHEDLKMGIANCIVAAKEGVDRLHATARGIGERAGNVNLEQLLVVLNLQGLRDINTSQIQEFARMAADILSVPIAPHEPIVGARSMETASGVHASAQRKGKGHTAIYLPFTPESVGLEAGVGIGPLSGLANVFEFCEQHNIKGVTEEKALEILDLAKSRWGLLSMQDVKNTLGRNGD